METTEQSTNTTNGTQARSISEVTKSLENAKPEEMPSTPQEIAELEKLARVKFDGREWTPEQLKKSIMMHSDYTKKTQEIAQDRKFFDNLPHDLAKVRANPQLVHEFRKVYPEKFHNYLDVLGVNSEPKQEKETDLTGIPRELIDRLHRVESYVKEKEVAVAEATLDKTIASMATKYPSANEDVVLAKAQALLDRGDELTEEAWDKLFKENHEKMESFFETKYKEKLTKTKQAAKQAKDTRSGGGIVGEAPKKMSMKEATEQAIRDLSGR